MRCLLNKEESHPRWLSMTFMFICGMVLMLTGSCSEFIDMVGMAVRLIGGMGLTFMPVMGIGMLTLALPCCSTEWGAMMVLWLVCWIVPMCWMDVIPSYVESGIAFIVFMFIRLPIGLIGVRPPMSPIFGIVTLLDAFMTDVSTIIICALPMFYR